MRTLSKLKQPVPVALYWLLTVTALIITLPVVANDQAQLLELNYGIRKDQKVLTTETPLEFPNFQLEFNPIKPGRCGAFDLDTTVLTSFDDGAFKRLQSQVIGQLQEAFNPAGLIGTAIKSANPDLYETLMNGVFNAETNFNLSLGQCEDIQRSAMGMFTDDLQAVADSEALSDDIATAEESPSEVDVTKSVKQVGNGDQGIEMADGVYKGGDGQPPIMIVADSTLAGYNALLDRDLDDTSPADNNTNTPITNVFTSPDQLMDYAAEVVGETELRTSSGANTERVPGKGVKSEARNYAEELHQDFYTVLAKPLSDIDQADLALVSAGNSLHITLDLIRILKSFPSQQQSNYINALVAKIAFAKEVEKLMLLRRALVAGLEVTRLKSFEAAIKEHESKLQYIDDELDMIEQELRLREMLAGNTIENIYKAYALRQQEYLPSVK